MRKILQSLLVPVVIFMIAGIFTGFKDITSDEAVAAELLNKRTELLQDVFYGKLDKDTAERYLAEIETHPLLEEDIDSIRTYEATDLDRIKGMEILSMEKGTKLFQFQSYDAKVKWTMSGYDGDYVTEADYYIVLNQTNDAQKLSRFTAK